MINKLRVVCCLRVGPEFINSFPSDKFEIIECLKQEQLDSLISSADFLVLGKYAEATKKIIEKGVKLKLIQRVGELYHNYVDIEAANKVRIPVSTMPTYIAISVAEHTMMLMFTLSRQLLRAHTATVNAEYEQKNIIPAITSEGEIPNTNWMNLRPELLYNKTLGIIGMGEIGTQVARKGKCFGMKILYYDTLRLPEIYEKEIGTHLTGFEELLRHSDFVTIHIPHTEKTSKMIGAREFSLMKKTAFLISISRGGVVDESALCEALAQGKIAGAGLDVYIKEPVAKDNPLLSLKNVVLTPHIAAVLRQELVEEAEWIHSNIERVVRGITPLNLVNPEV